MSTRRTRVHRMARLAASGALVLVPLTGCGITLLHGPTEVDPAAHQWQDAEGPGQDDSEGEDGADGDGLVSGAALAKVPTVPGYAPGQIPPIPLVRIPDPSIVAGASSTFTSESAKALASTPGIFVELATCEGSGVKPGWTVLHPDDGGETAQDGTSAAGNGTGMGTYSDGTVNIVNHGDGSVVHQNIVTQQNLNVLPDGSGNYNDLTSGLQILLHSDGSGHLDDPAADLSISIAGDGGGSVTWGEVSVTNFGDGSGRYQSRTLVISNEGEGWADVNGVRVAAEPLPPVGKLGRLKPLPAVAPTESCGTLILVEDSALFDFGKSEVRADARSTISTLAGVFTSLSVPSATVTGHTDSVSDEAFNQTLSEQRAAAVVEALQAVGVKAALSAEGKGESQPVAPNENADGSDNPSGRQLNRRVEIFVPNF
ncbi:OmpA family protein [Schaalia sp. 19OD2882]|uniref:OmpA family protein n=1 Tax=Schaalia sp. 19OD2882 TaxID=2794089 RepID=UPI001C1F197C|nr:OmpA family protein [Schaalia sp. 19OD2882]QWW19026.1 OmpA family protein [Schaalia sp. 19OD2882]